MGVAGEKYDMIFETQQLVKLWDSSSLTANSGEYWMSIQQETLSSDSTILPGYYYTTVRQGLVTKINRNIKG